MMGDSDRDMVQEFVRRVCIEGIKGDTLPTTSVLGVKFEYDDRTLALTAYHVARERFGDVVARMGNGKIAQGLLEDGEQLSDFEYKRCTAKLTEWVLGAWRSCSVGRLYRRGWLGVHDSIFMVDLDRGVEGSVDFDRLQQ